ncbi:hypothetical protein AT575_04090 [Streptococcus penaeicida]|uniref:Phage envelope protein n=1 Tax=Streptococcus penaeicida TaxID=1765960 RepID=A0A2N8LD29_9STRE|nr:DUF1398 family protein [Streptococcus penaeicida]PND48060.1 hypothetical protein AT575_04090 [Streptococcus penaeicida]
MLTKEMIMAAQELFSGNDFPGLVKAFLEMGIVANTVNIKEGQATYQTAEGQEVELPAYRVESVAGRVDEDYFIQQLRKHQKQETDFPTFCQDTAASGIYKWDVDLLAKTCSYFDLDNKLVYTEAIPV